MSTYYCYCIGYKDSDNKIFPVGPYDYQGKLRYIIKRSRSYVTDINELFYNIPKNAYSDELIHALTGGKCDREEYLKYSVDQYLPVSELPDGNFIQTGYFLISDVDRYLKAKDENERNDLAWSRLFVKSMSEAAYAAKLQNELMFENHKETSNHAIKGEDRYADIDDEERFSYSCKDYMYFSYPDVFCKEYDAFLLREALNSYIYDIKIPEGSEWIIICSIG